MSGLTPTPLPKPLLVVLGVGEKVLTRLAASVLPWSQRSQHDAYLNGYRDGLRDGGPR